MRGIFFCFIGAASWGFSGACISWLTTYTNADVVWLATLRLLIAGALFLVLALIRRRDALKHLFTTPHLILQLVVYTLIGVILLQISYMAAIKLTNTPTAMLLQESSAAFVLVYTCLREKRSPVLPEIIALCLAAFGILCIATQGDPTSLSISIPGLVWGLLSGVAYAGYMVIPVRLNRECGILTVNATSLLLGGIILTPFVQPWKGTVHLDLNGWLVLAGVIAVGTMLAYFVFMRGVLEAGTVRASLIAIFEPVSGAIIAALWLGTTLSVWDLVGGIAILAMMAVAALYTKP